MRSEAVHNGNGPAPLGTQSGVTRDLLDRQQKTGNLFRMAVLLFGALFVLGVVGFILRLQDGVDNTLLWGYHAAVFAFILTTAQAAPIAAIAPRLAKAHWRRPTSRVAELFTVVGLFNLLLFIPLLWVLPGLDDGRRSLWFLESEGEGLILDTVPVFSPHIWSTLAIVFMVLVGLALLYVSCLPDFAAMRDRSTGRRQRWFARLARGWHGSSAQWNMQEHRMGILGALYFMMLVFVHFLISVDFMMALVPGWIDALFPATHAANSLQAGVATVLVTMFILRQFGGYRDYLRIEHFWALGKLLLALSLLWFWFWFSSFNILWYGKKPGEQNAIELLMTGPYQPAFMASFVLNFVVPFFVLIWNPVRKSIWGPTLIAMGVLIGTFFDRIRLYVAAYSVPGIGDPTVDKHEMHEIPVANMPDMADVFIMVGAISGSILVYLLATRIIPPINVWEQKELLLYRIHKPFVRTEVQILGKKD